MRSHRRPARWITVTVWTVFAVLAMAALGTLTPQYAHAQVARHAAAATCTDTGAPSTVAVTSRMRFDDCAPLDTSHITWMDQHPA